MGQSASRTTHNRGEFSGGGCPVHSKRQGRFAMIKEHKSRLYIVRRCILMLICWHKYKISE
ncbi:hypothetical protein JHK87_030303 [Glycine soja]|nr:hypothetical protein JHK87_030303 [Glycine soja]